jgi:hypothetical protein
MATKIKIVPAGPQWAQGLPLIGEGLAPSTDPDDCTDCICALCPDRDECDHRRDHDDEE